MYTQKMQMTHEISAQNLRQCREYYASAKSFSCAIRCNKMEEFIINIVNIHTEYYGIIIIRGGLVFESNPHPQIYILDKKPSMKDLVFTKYI